MSDAAPDIGAKDEAANPIFAARLVPHRSLSRAGFVLVMAFVIIACVSNAIFYIKLGAWPVAIFLALDILLLWGAFKLSYRSGRACEEVTVSRANLLIRKIAPSGRYMDHSYNPFWARFHVERHDEIGITAMRVTGEGRTTALGQFLNPDDRETFADAFSDALATARR